MNKAVKSVSVWDIDDTLLVSDARIKVYETKVGASGVAMGKLLIALTPQEFNTYHSKDTKTFTISNDLCLESTVDQNGDSVLTIADYSDFRCINIMKNGKKIKPMFEQLVTDAKYHELSVITARGKQELITEYFEHLQVEINPELAYAINDARLGFTGSTAEKKQQAFGRMIEMGYKKFKFYDDDVKNLQLAHDICNQHDVELYSYHVNETDRRFLI